MLIGPGLVLLLSEDALGLLSLLEELLFVFSRLFALVLLLPVDVVLEDAQDLKLTDRRLAVIKLLEQFFSFSCWLESKFLLLNLISLLLSGQLTVGGT